MAKRSTTIFIVFVILWEIAVGLLYGFFLRYNTTAFSSMVSNPNLSAYKLALSPTTYTTVIVDSTLIPYPHVVISIAIILLIVGFAMVAGYIERSSVTGMAFTLLIFAFTVQNYFIFRQFWKNCSINDPNGSANFSNRIYPYINLINFGNGLTNPYTYTSSSFIDAIGASLALYAGYTAVIGRIGLGQIFFLTWIGTFLYELSSQLLWRLYIPDTGYPSRAFAFGGALGLVSSLILGKKNLTANNPYYSSRYRVMGLALLGIIFVWCAFPILLLGSTLQSATGVIVAMTGQVNIWLALASSVLGVFSACSIYHRKFSVHELVFTSITGAIAYSSSSDLNYNTGAATAIGFGVSFICCLCQMGLKRKINSDGVVDSNSVIFHFLLPSLFAAAFSAIMQAIGNTAASYSGATPAGSTTVLTYNSMVQPGRTSSQQAGYQIIGWLISVGIGAVAGVIIGLLYKCTNDQEQGKQFFNDAVLYDYPKAQNDIAAQNRQIEGPPQTHA